VIQLACLGFGTYVLGLQDRLSYNIFLVIGIGLATVFRYGAHKKWVWRAQPLAPPAAAQLRREPVLPGVTAAGGPAGHMRWPGPASTSAAYRLDLAPSLPEAVGSRSATALRLWSRAGSGWGQGGCLFAHRCP